MDNNDYYSSEWSDKSRTVLIETEKKPVASVLEKAGFIMAAVIMLVVIVVMTSDIKLVTFKQVTELSLSFFVLIFCSYSMYGNMYHSGMIAGKKLDEYNKVCKEYAIIRAEIKERDVQKQLAAFCKVVAKRLYRGEEDASRRGINSISLYKVECSVGCLFGVVGIQAVEVHQAQ